MLFQSGDLKRMMYMAIINNRVNFVHLLMKNGVCLREFLTVLRLRKLYNDVRLKLFSVLHILVYLLVLLTHAS